MLRLIGDLASARKLRLFACACCRLVWHWLEDDDTRSAVRMAERFAEGEVGPAALARTAFRVPGAEAYPEDDTYWIAVDTAADAAIRCCNTDGDLLATASRVAQMVVTCEGAWMNVAEADLVRCIFGNPFYRPLPVPAAVLAWHDRTVPRLARSIYEERAFERLPILHDALLDAGCDDEALLGHCRAGGEHVRGCWAIDLILEKS
jgi:hypothetical protein